MKYFFILLVLFLTGCSSLKNSSKYGFNEGFYQSRLFHKKMKKLYVVPDDDSIRVYTVKKLQKEVSDSTISLKIAFPLIIKQPQFEKYIFHQRSFDIDVLNIIFKFRPSVRSFPPQFNNSIVNGAAYFGYRTDWYALKYEKTPLHIYKRNIAHYGFSYGLFTGIGATPMNEYVTQNSISIEYDGVVYIFGAAVLIGIDRVSFGINVGVDHLMDENKKYWIYQGKPWIGLSVGLNLN
jgi:hypothetical protein